MDDGSSAERKLPAMAQSESGEGLRLYSWANIYIYIYMYIKTARCDGNLDGRPVPEGTVLVCTLIEEPPQGHSVHKTFLKKLIGRGSSIIGVPFRAEKTPNDTVPFRYSQFSFFRLAMTSPTIETAGSRQRSLFPIRITSAWLMQLRWRLICALSKVDFEISHAMSSASDRTTMFSLAIHPAG